MCEVSVEGWDGDEMTVCVCVCDAREAVQDADDALWPVRIPRMNYNERIMRREVRKEERETRRKIRRRVGRNEL